MKKLLPIFILIFGLSVFGQKTLDQFEKQIKSFKSAKNCGADYDKFADKTTVYCRANKDLMFDTIVSFDFTGDKLPETVDNFVLGFQFTSREWRFLDNRDLVILADGERVPFGSGKRNGKVNTNSRYASVTEYMTFFTNRETLSSLAKAKKMEFKLGNFAYAMSDKAQDLFNNILVLGTVEK